MADFKVLTPEQIKHIKPVDPSILTFMMHEHTEETHGYLNELLKVDSPNNDKETYWFPTPEEPGDISTHTTIQQRIYKELLGIKELEQLDPKKRRYPKSISSKFRLVR